MKTTLLALAAGLAPLPALADGSDLVEKATPGIVTAVVFGTILFVVAIVTFAGHRNRMMRHETIRLALEKGVAPPHELLEEPQKAIDESRDLRRGLTLSGLGLGLALCLYFLPTDTAHEAPWSLGFVPLLVGLGYLGTWFVRGRPTGSQRPPAPPLGERDLAAG
jgi:drug/metabolite transporter (DMT)-like permease